MQEYKYQLQKDDYMDWIHWNVARQDMKKTKMISIIIFAGFCVFYIGRSAASGKGMVAISSSLITLAMLGGLMYYMLSAHNRERMIWKRSGLKKLEKTNSFPKITLTIEEKGFSMEVPDQVRNEFSYTDIAEIEETPRLFLLGTSDQRWQFVAKTAFADQEEAQQFKNMILEKREDAREHPEKYEKEEPKQEPLYTDEALEDRTDSETSFEEEDGTIEQVDTSSMGKIGKMAHIMAAMAAENEADAPAEVDPLEVASEITSGDPEYEPEHKEEECTDGDSDSREE